MERKNNFGILPPINQVRSKQRYSLSVKPRHNQFLGGIAKQQNVNLKIPKVSAKCWAIYDVNKMTFVNGKREYFKREIASLTKIMTCHVVILLCKQYGLNL